MDFLKAEIARKRKQIQDKNVLQPEKKYFKRGDLAAAQEAEYLAKYGPKMDDIAELEEKKAAALEERGLVDSDDPLYPLAREEVVSKLRQRREPVLLFGETEEQANLRLRALELGESDDSFKLKNSSNNFQEALRKVDKDYLKAVERDDKKQDRNNMELKLYNINRTWSELLELANDLRRGDHKHDVMVISEWIKVIMTMWGKELNSREEEEKMTVQGRMDAATFKQTMGYLKPLLKMLRKGTLSEDIRDSLSNMVRNVMQRDYIKANERYMEMAIGNAPWPIGVTNAGIHARPGRERIFSKHVAHVLNDESQRKYIQGLKRLMTKCQQYFITEPSRCMDYVRLEEPGQPIRELQTADPREHIRTVSFISGGQQDEKKHEENEKEEKSPPT